MDLTALILWLLLMVNSISTDSVAEVSQEDDEYSTVALTEKTTTSVETKTMNTIDVLQSQLTQILVQFCASEIDRNKTASAILKFGQLADAKSAMKNVVEFYIDNYEDNFDNLFPFIDQISSLDLQNVAYSTLVEAAKLNRINVINLLSFESFIRTKFKRNMDKDLERKIFEDLLLIAGNQIKELIIATDLNRLIIVINGSDNPSRIFELIPRIVQGIDLTDFNDMDRIFKFSMQLPIINQLKLIREVLLEMRNKTQYQHLFHVILQIRILERSVTELADKCLLSIVEKEIPVEYNQLLSGDSRWQIMDSIMNSAKYLNFQDTAKYSRNILYLSSSKHYSGWQFMSQNANSISIYSTNYGGRYLGIEYCFHNDSFPVAAANNYYDNDHTQKNWYLLMASDLTYLQIKNIRTNEVLVNDYIKEITNEGLNPRLALSSNCFDCEESKWFLKLEFGEYLPSNYGCPSQK